MKKLIFFLASLFVLEAAVAQSTSDEIVKALDQKLEEIYKASKLPGISFTLVLQSDAPITFVKGMADIERNIAMTPDTKMPGGSTGKVFYSVVAMQLMQEGRLELDLPISNYLKGPWLKRIPNGEALTVRHLMRHQSGLPRYIFNPAFPEEVRRDADRVWKPEELLAFVFDADPLFEAGTSFAYSDTNYILLAMVIEAVTGNDLYDEVERRVLQRAGLKNVVPQTGRQYENLAQGYSGENDPFFPGKALDENGVGRYNWQFEWAGGGLVITTRDLAVLNKKIFEGNMFEMLMLPTYLDGVAAGELGGEWGWGVHIQDTPHGKTFGHSGYMPGYITNVLHYKDYGFSICYQVNTSDRSRLQGYGALAQLADIIVEGLKK